jgi:hypothetical protein
MDAQARVSGSDDGRTGQGGHFVDIDTLTAAGLFVGGLLAGAINAVAGGSSFITFPLLLAAGLPPLVANTTSFVALSPANAVALVAYRTEIARVRHLLPGPLAISAVGGILGSILLIWSGEARFERLVPWLILASTVLFAFGTWIKGELKRRSRFVGAEWTRTSSVLLFVLAVYGGYFGAGMGIVLLACLSLFGYDDLHEANAVKNAFITIFSIIGAGIFIAGGLVVWPHALVVLAGTMVGGYVGIRYARQVPERTLRLAILAWAIVLTGYAFWRYG